MPYEDVVAALEQETDRSAREIVEAAAAERDRRIGEAHRAAEEARAAALESARARARAERETARRAVDLDGERVLLIAKRRLLEQVRLTALERLASRRTPALTARLLDEIRPEIEAEPAGEVVLVVDPGESPAIAAHLARASPALLGRAAIREAAAPRGGVWARVGGLVLDDTLPARLVRAFDLLETPLCEALFGSGDVTA